MLIDISMPITPEMTVWKDYPHKKPVFVNKDNFTNASHYETDLHINLHTGTHVDAPLHMMEGGHTMANYDLNRFYTRARVLDLSHVASGMITQAHLEGYKPQKGEFLLLKTRNSFRDDFEVAFASVSADGAQYLASCGIDGVGIDALGIERSQPGHETHKALLGNDIIIIEGLRLAHVEEGTYQLIALPLHLPGVEASLLRAALVPIDSLSEA